MSVLESIVLCDFGYFRDGSERATECGYRDIRFAAIVSDNGMSVLAADIGKITTEYLNLTVIN